jgi:tRNA uridine 5-carboxymethylaminomethyl modification enzyme
MVEEMKKQEDTLIPDELNYDKINSLSAEGKQKMDRIRPETLGQASRISGVTPSDISVLMVYLNN